jgi:hypothetical protein
MELLPPAKQQADAEEGEVKTPDIKIKAISRTIRYGNGDGRIKTEAYEIRVPLEILSTATFERSQLKFASITSLSLHANVPTQES